MKRSIQCYFFSLRFLFMISEDLLFFVMPVAAFQLGAGVQVCGILYFLMIFFRLIIYPFAGFLCDRISSEIVFTAAMLSRAALCGGACLLLIRSDTAMTIWMLMVITVMEGILSGLVNVSFDAAIPTLTQSGDFVQVSAAVQMADQVAVLAAPLAGALFFRQFYLHTIFRMACIAYGSAGFLFAFRFRREIKSAMALPSTWSTRLSSFSFHEFLVDFYDESLFAIKLTSGSKPLGFLLVLTLMDNFLMGLQGASMAPLALGFFGKTEATFGFALTLGGVAALIAVGFSPWIIARSSLRKLWLSSYFVGYLGFLLSGIAANFLSFALGLGLVELSCGVGIYALKLVRSEFIPEAHSGKTLGSLYFLQQLSLPLGGLLVGGLGSVQRLQSLIIISTLACGMISYLLFQSTHGVLKSNEA